MVLDEISLRETYELSPTHVGYRKDDCIVEALRKGATKVRVRTRNEDRLLWVHPNQLQHRGL